MNGFLFKSGDTVLDGYTVEKPLGHGGFGEVYHARSAAGKDVALKLIQRFLEVELRGVGHCLNLKHPHLVTIYDVRTDSEGRQWIVMEYVAGESLSDAIAKHPDGMPVEEALLWFEPICLAVEHLHQSGIVHRDLKPGNIFDDRGALSRTLAASGTVDDDRGTVKVGDYGLSKFITASKRSAQTQSVGTLHYMAPEVGSGRYGREVDVYAVGVILYEMLTGKVPFDGETPAEILMKHLTSPPDLDALPVAFRGVVARMLAKNPNDRYGSLASVLTDLKAKLADAAHAEAIGEPSRYPAYEQSIVSHAGVSGWLEAPFEFLKNLGREPESRPAANTLEMPAAASDWPRGRPLGVWAWIADAFRVQPAGVGVCLFLSLAALLIGVVAVDQPPGSDDAFFAWLLFIVLVHVAAAGWIFVARAVSRRRGGQPPPGTYGRSNGGASDRLRPEGGDPAWGRPAAYGPPAPPVHMGATEFWDSARGGGGYDVPPPGPLPWERREATGDELIRFRRWTSARRWAYCLGSLFMAVCLGLGIGLLAAGMSLLMFGHHRDDPAAFFGTGAGFLSAGLILSKRLSAIPGPLKLRMLIPLFLGGGVGLSVSGLMIATYGWTGPAHEAAVLFGVGSGFMTAAAVAWGLRLSIGRSPLLRVLSALFWGGGVGAICGAIALGMVGRANDEIGAFFGVGAGVLTTGVFLCRFIMDREDFPGLKLLASLFIGGGVGLLTAGVGLVMTRNDEVAAFLGTGSGFLTCGMVAWHLFTTDFAARVRPRY